MTFRRTARASGGLGLAGSILVLCACGDAAAPAPLGTPAGAGGEPVPTLSGDEDGDDLCDLTEDVAGTDPRVANTDGDALPDLFEVAYNFNPADPEVPAQNQVGYLEARPGESLDFALRATVDGDGQGHTGLFRAQTSVYGPGDSAGRFFTGSQAVSADPADNVRGVEADASRFGSVLGSTRLAFSLRFQFPADTEPEDCARAYPFRYELKGDDGENRARRQFLLVVAPAGGGEGDGPWCRLPSCY